LPTDIQIIKHPIWEPYTWASLFSKKKTKKISSGIIPRKKVSILDKVLLWIRGNCFIPDARKFWVKPSVKYLNKFIKENQIETIITTSPPHSVHLIGYELKKQISHLKWISDFRDPWTTIGYYKDLRLTKWADKRQHYWEKEVLQQSDLVITTSFKTQKDFQQLTNTPIEVITNGYDEEKTITPPLSNKFLISHIGSLLSDRNPKILSNMKGTEHFTRTIAEYLNQRAMTDPLFAPNLMKPNKNIEECITYILNEVQKSGCNGFDDDEIFSMAVHYYDEDDIEVGKAVSCQVAVNHVVELTAEEKAEARQNAVRRYQEEELRKLQNRSKPRTATKATAQEVQQPNLFNF